jgi:DNA-directed RNA polymerase specialized sigma24 family protein
MEVRKLFYAAFARGLVKDGYDPEEALQEVYRGLLARNNGTCPLDTKKSSFGHYVHIVTRCVLANYIRKEKRRTQFESNESQMSPRSAGEDAFQVQEQVDKRRGVKIEPGSLERLSEKLAARHGAGVQAALQMLSEGHPVRKVVATLGVERMWLDEVLADAKSQLTE